MRAAQCSRGSELPQRSEQQLLVSTSGKDTDYFSRSSQFFAARSAIGRRVSILLFDVVAFGTPIAVV